MLSKVIDTLCDVSAKYLKISSNCPLFQCSSVNPNGWKECSLSVNKIKQGSMVKRICSETVNLGLYPEEQFSGSYNLKQKAFPSCRKLFLSMHSMFLYNFILIFIIKTHPCCRNGDFYIVVLLLSL